MRGARLHLGCGGQYLDGWVNIDGAPESRADLHIDIRSVGDYFTGGSVASVMMVHVLGYLRLWEARRLFGDVHNLLQAGGEFILEQPDLARCCERVLEKGVVTAGDLSHYLEGVRGIFAFGIEQDGREEKYTSSAFGWSAAHLRHELALAGFRDITVQPGQSHGHAWRDLRLECRK